MLLMQNINVNNKLSCRRETARGFVLLNILPSHSRSFEMTLLSRACASPYSFSTEIVCILRYSASKNGETLKPEIGVFENGAVR